MKVVLTQVLNDDHNEFSHLLGTQGEPRHLDDHAVFLPDNTEDWLDMTIDLIIANNTKLITITTTVGHTFFFRKVPTPNHAIP